jgi:L-ascorbate metabolism protein UlaG (beta-lactamase superfamily)
MQLQLIRSATLRVRYADQMCLTDPFLAAKHTMPSYGGVSPNPLVDLPISAEEVVADVDMTIISHLHADHFDAEAQRILPKDAVIFCQPGDEDRIAAKGFHQVTPVVDSIQRQGITLTRTPGQHGAGKVLDDMGIVSGFVFQANGEPTVYWAGDTIWCEAVREAITRFSPDVIITHSCGAVWGNGGLIVMDAAQTVEVCRAAPRSIVVAIHMDSVDHATVTRADLRAFAQQAGVSEEQLRIPRDGETLAF